MRGVSAVFFLLITGGVLYGAFTGDLTKIGSAAVRAGQEALETVVGLIGSFAFFGGLIGILEKAGAIGLMSRAMRRPLEGLFGKNAGDEAFEAVSVNLAANMLGLSNAATPMGMRAARLLNAEHASTPSDALCMLLVINATSVQLLPSSVIALRNAAGSGMADAVVLPGLAASAVSTAVGIALCKLLQKREKREKRE